MAWSQQPSAAAPALHPWQDGPVGRCAVPPWGRRRNPAALNAGRAGHSTWTAGPHAGRIETAHWMGTVAPHAPYWDPALAVRLLADHDRDPSAQVLGPFQMIAPDDPPDPIAPKAPLVAPLGPSRPGTHRLGGRFAVGQQWRRRLTPCRVARARGPTGPPDLACRRPGHPWPVVPCRQSRRKDRLARLARAFAAQAAPSAAIQRPKAQHPARPTSDAPQRGAKPGRCPALYPPGAARYRPRKSSTGLDCWVVACDR